MTLEQRAWRWIDRIDDIAPYDKAALVVKARQDLYIAINAKEREQECRRLIWGAIWKLRRHNLIVDYRCRIRVRADFRKVA